MDSRAYGLAGPALGLSLRMILVAGMAVLLALDLTTTRHYATALVLALLLALVLFETARRYSGIVISVPMATSHHAQARQQDRAEALLDAVSVALVTMQPDGRVGLVNRASRILAGQEVARLADMNALGPDAAEIIQALPVGARQVVTIANGSPMLVWIGTFAGAGQPAQKLISLQAVTGELDAVQLRAWMDMSRILSHEIMNSLTPITSLSESLGRMLARQGAVNSDAAEAIAAIGRRSQHLMSFVERYRRIADLPAPVMSNIAAADLVSELEAIMKPVLAARLIVYNGAPPPSDLIFRGDAALLSQALINLLHNAADAASQSQAPRIGFAATGDGNRIVFTIMDNGRGIPTEHLQDIFLPFFTTKSGGSGIGLTLARQITLAHGGQIAAEANPGGGTRFRLSLPSMN